MPFHTVALDLTLREVLADIPHDAGALVVLILMAAFVGFIWWGSRQETVERYAGRSVDPSTASGPAASEVAPTPPRPSRSRAEGDS